jgi:hypothetical protein
MLCECAADKILSVVLSFSWLSIPIVIQSTDKCFSDLE